MRLGAYIMQEYRDVEGYIGLLQKRGYRAAYCPDYLHGVHQRSEIEETRQALRERDIVLAEVGTWVNPLSPNDEERRAAEKYLIERLALAEELEARCCVNVLGSLSGDCWYAPCAENFDSAFLVKAARVYRRIIDAVDVKHTKMTFEIMPYSLLDGVGGYLSFLQELDRPQQTAVHLDPINLIHDPRTLYNHRAVIKDAVDRLGGRIVSVHLKDIVLDKRELNVHLNEVPPGQGEVDLEAVLRDLSALSEDLPVMLEHLPDDAAYDEAAAHVRAIAARCNFKV